MDRRLIWFIVLLLPVLGWSLIAPHDYFTWFLEVAPALVGVPLMFFLHRRFPLSTFLLVLIWLHCGVLIFGGHYTYAKVPLGEWAKGWFGWKRNDYDKLGHFAQGFVPAILAREILLRSSSLKYQVKGPFDPVPRGALVPATPPSRWLGFIIVSICLGFSALYELVEWIVAISSGAAADDFLGTQGDNWDTQSDMAMALVGAIVAVVFVTKLHDRSLAKLGKEMARAPAS